MQELFTRKKGLERKILIVDDEYIEREMLAAMLSDLYDVSYSENGEDALVFIKENKYTLSLVILDLHMPKLDGYSLLKIIRSDAQLRRIPVVVLTSEKGSEVECLQMGAADFITKPYEAPDIVRARVGRAIELAEDSIIIHETERDSLTKLFNKEFFFEYGKRLDRQWDNSPMDAVVVDINRFRIVNALYGRSYGDEVLKKIGNALHDFVNNVGGLACRSGSNSFDIYIPHYDDLEEKIKGFFSKLEQNTKENKVTVRVGICLDEGQPSEMVEKFDRARLACHKLSSGYTNCLGFYDSKIQNREIYEERLIKDMDTAIEEHQFKVYFQPKYNITAEVPRLTSAEALVRWFHPELGMISPGDFISVFENNGLIQKLDRFVWSETAKQIKQWKQKYGKSIPVSVNVSRVDIFEPKLEEILLDIVKGNSLSTGELLLEITESAYTYDSMQIVEKVSSLRNKGFKIEMDDFGCGYSSLNMLTALPIDALKLDMKFIRNIETNPKDYSLVCIMTEIAKLLNVPVIAEGVETKGQVDLLKKAGCDIIQGYYFSKPLPTKEFDALIDKGTSKNS